MIAGLFSDHKVMTPEEYSEAVSRLNLKEIECSCGQRGSLVQHGYYRRRLKSGIGTFFYTVMRLRCTSCRRTHAVIPDMIVPYSQLPLDIQLDMLRNRLGDLEPLFTLNPDIAESDALSIRFRFHHFWEEKLDTVNANLNIPLPELMEICYSEFKRQFMQNHRGNYHKSS